LRQLLRVVGQSFGGGMRSSARLCAVVLSALGFLIRPCLAQTTPPTLHVATFVLPPYVMRQDKQLTGFSIDLWDAVARHMKVRTDYQIMPDVNALLAAIRSKTADVGASGVFITEERDKYADFSVPILNAGMQVMVRETGGRIRGNALTSLFYLLFSKTTLVWLGIALLFMIIPAHLIWLLERRYKGGIIPTERYIPGVAHALHWAATTLLTQSAQTPRRPLARVINFVWMFVGIVFVALYTAQLTASLTIQQIRGAINGPDDLPGKLVATYEGSTSADYLRDHNVEVAEFQQTDTMFDSLLKDEVDAVLFSGPTLHYFAAHAGVGKVKLVGHEFRKMDLGFVVPVDSSWRRDIDLALLALRDDGTYDRIYRRWFGSD
jgi:polar amino acid transport system substrate-binding protein